MARYGDLDTQYFDDAGDPLVDGKIFFFESGTTTPKLTFSDVNFTIPNAHPVALTAAGRQPNIFFQGVAKAILATSAGVQILVRDPVGETAATFGNPWIASKDYNANEVVQGSDGEFYVALVNGNVNNNPVTTSGFWTFLYSVEWSQGRTYKVGSIVTYEAIVYQSLQDANLNQDPDTQSAFWIPIQLSWIATQVYAIDVNVVGPDGILYTSLQNGNTGNTPASSPAFWVGTSAAAAASATAAADSAAAALVSENAAGADAIATAADAVQTGLDVIATAADAVQTGLDAAAAAASAASFGDFDERFLGAKTSDPTLDNEGNPLIEGALYFNSATDTSRVYNGVAWQDVAPVATSINVGTQVTGVLNVVNGGTGLSTLGTAGQALVVNSGATGLEFATTGAPVFTYDDRGDLRDLSAEQDDQAVVEGLGYFVFAVGSTEPDDDESCFATTTGRWLLEAIHWDVCDTWNLPDDQARDAFDQDEPIRFASRFLFGTALCSITSVTATNHATFTGTVVGASSGDTVICTPPDKLGNTNVNTGRLSFHAYVSSANTVTVVLTNASALGAGTNTAVRTNWSVAIMKST